MERDAPYRSQELRPPDAPRPAWVAEAARSLKLVAAIAALATCCLPRETALAPVLVLFGACALAAGLLDLGHAVARRPFPRWWRGGARVVVGAMLLTQPAGGVCADAREKEIIAGVHAWRAARGRYPESLAELPGRPRPAACRVPTLPSITSGFRYWYLPGQDDAVLTRMLFGPARKVYNFRDRRFRFLD